MGDKESVNDLAEGSLPGHEKQWLELERSQLRQQISHQRWAFGISIAFSIAMTVAFLVFCYKVVCLAANYMLLDWHLLLLGSGLIVPPTIIMFALIRRLYPAGSELKTKDDQDEDVPAIGLLSEVSSMVKEVTELVGTVTKKFDPKP